MQRHFKTALWLAWFTIIYNVLEGAIATTLGLEDESYALFGFGVDSFIEVLSGIGILHMLTRIRNNGNETRDEFERTALRITGTAFYILAIGLVVTATLNVYYQRNPTTTFWGVVIAAISITIMWIMIVMKTKVGNVLHSKAILADAQCSRVCIWMSVVLLVSSGLYELFHLPHIDALGCVGLAIFSFREGKECFEKSAGEHLCGCHDEKCVS